jgi:hypothetical protein
MKGKILDQEYDVNGFYFDYSCNKCGQNGTARFKTEDVAIDGEGCPIPKKLIYCCECRRKDVTIDDSGDY